MGDIHPRSGPARLLVSGQMVLSVFVVVSAIGVAIQRYLAPATRFVRARAENDADGDNLLPGSPAQPT